MKRPSRMKYQMNKSSYYLLLLFLVLNLAYTIISLETLQTNTFIGIDVFINVTVSLMGFLAAAKVKVYDRNWTYITVAFGLFQLIRMLWTPQLNIEWAIYLVLSSVAALLAAYISFHKVHILDIVSKDNYDESIEIEHYDFKKEIKETSTEEPIKKLVLKRVNKIYPNGVHAVHNFNLEIKEKEFVVLVGPSGCGKSTTLRMIAGLEGITSGDMYLYDKRINNLAPHDRDIAMIFQDYALYGHMTVYDNMGFSLKLRRDDSISIHDKVKNVSEIVQLENELARLPKNLSGGQRQRVALGRSIVRDAEIFLMDEPLSNLDAKLRSSTRKEIVKIHHELDATIVYVTHDQIEAMTMATKIVVMDLGYIQQVGSPIEVYNEPNNLFVAGFIGMPPMNFIEGEIKEDHFISDNFKFRLDNHQLKMLKKYLDRPITLGIRPEHFSIDLQYLNKGNWEFDVTVESIEYQGANQIVRYYIDNKLYNASLKTRDEIKVGDEIRLAILKSKVHFFDTISTLRISDDYQQLNFFYNGEQLVLNDKVFSLSAQTKQLLKGLEHKEVGLTFKKEDIKYDVESDFKLEVTDFIPYGDTNHVEFTVEGIKVQGRLLIDRELTIGEEYPVTFDFNSAKFIDLSKKSVVEGDQ